MNEYEEQKRHLYSVNGSQSAKSWASWPQGLEVLGDVAAFIHNPWVLFLRGHGGSTSPVMLLALKDDNTTGSF